MRVKIGDKWYNSNIQPICIQVNKTEQGHIADLDRSVASNGKYASFPETMEMSREEMFEWMREISDGKQE